jgi:hypothetical protein
MLPELQVRKVRSSRKFCPVQLGRAAGVWDELQVSGDKWDKLPETLHHQRCCLLLPRPGTMYRPNANLRILRWNRSSGTPIAPIRSRKGCQPYFNRHTIRFGSLEFAVFAYSRDQNLLHAELPNNLRFCMSSITNFLMGRLDPSARFGRTKTWHGTPIALQNDRHFRNFAGTAVLCP